jgi:hypothetical protein
VDKRKGFVEIFGRVDPPRPSSSKIGRIEDEDEEEDEKKAAHAVRQGSKNIEAGRFMSSLC